VSILRGKLATVDIRAGKKTVFHYLFKPIIKTKETVLRGTIEAYGDPDRQFIVRYARSLGAGPAGL
jgi:hypothetical protein